MASEKSWFWPQPEPLDIAEVARLAGAELWRPPGAVATELRRIAPLETGGPGDVVFFDNPKYLDALATCRASVCIVAPRFRDKVPATAAVLVADQPARAIAALMAAMFPAALRPGSFHGDEAGVSPGAHVHPLARLERGVSVDPGAVIGAGAEIGAGSVIGAGATIARDVKIGRDCSIAAGVTVQHALVGNRVILHPGARIGQDGFGYAMGARGHAKIPQIGRVILQDDVEIGANTTIDRGANRDTMIGEGAKIDNLVQIGHNVVVGRHCVIAGHVAIAGSATLGDFVAIGGRTGVIGHVTIGEGAQIASASNVATDVPGGARWGGTPAKPVREWLREVTFVAQLAARGGKGGAGGKTEA